MTLSPAIAGALEMPPFPWAAVTPRAHTIKARAASALDLSDSEYFLIVTQCQ